MFKRLLSGRRQAAGSSAATAEPPSQLKAPAAAPVIAALDRLGEKAALELGRAKESAKRGNKRAALMALRRKRLYEQQLEQIETSIMRLSEQQLGLEGVRVTAETVSAMQAGAQASKAAALGVEQVDSVLEELAEQTEQLRQVQDVLGTPLGMAAEVDDDELAAELEEMEAAQLEEACLQAAAAPSPSLPAVSAPALPRSPTVPLEAGRRVQAQGAGMRGEVEAELEALQAEMAA
ncbi:hypothetical protein D9Q98_008849 [Chlorella vulgaris]|uniref:Uncharacterized protein n=1 Tax=Chlorella vulgaris TaxID=3077 RepID=A0A9D4TIS1_CHLVU|nr:hypothetical protein D9Q98_008849 [Chlorella vulgaris]